MTTRKLYLLLASGIIVAAATTVWSFDDKSKPPATEADWKKLTQPGEYHKRLEPLAGKWNQLVRQRNAPDDKWQESKGSTEFRWLLGGRFLMEEAHSRIFDTPFDWVGIYGYDNHKKKYTAVWIDNFGTEVDTAECDADPTGKVLSFSGEQDNPGGGKEPYRWVITIESKDKSLVEMFMPGPDGKLFKNMEIIQTRP